MSSIDDAKTAIYNKLINAPTYKPSSADLFTDWTLQSGDVITVSSDGTDYDVPIFGLKMRWNGVATVQTQATGNEKREPLQAMAQKQSQRRGSSYRSGQKRQDMIQFIVGVDANGEYFIDHPGSITLAINEANQSVAHIDADHVNISATNTFYSLAGEMERDSQGRLVIKNAGGLYVERNNQGTTTTVGVWDKGELTGGMMVTQINGQTTNKITGDHIVIGTSETSTVTLNNQITVDADGNLYINGNIYAGLSGQYYIQGTTLKLVGASSSQGANVQTLGATDVQYMIIKAEVDNSTNTLKLWKKGDSLSGDPSITFSRATTTTLSGAWGSGNTKITVTASPQSVDYDIGFGTNYGANDMDLEIVANGNPSLSQSVSNAIEIPIKVNELQSGQTPPTARYTKDLTVAMSSLLQSKSATSPKTGTTSVTPDNDKLGLSSVTVNAVTVSSVACTTGGLATQTTEYASPTIRATASNTATKDQYYSLERANHSSTYYAELKEGTGNDQIVIARISTMPTYNSGVKYGMQNSKPFIGNAGTTIWDNRKTSITSNGTYYLRAYGRSQYNGSDDTYSNNTYALSVNVPSGGGHTDGPYTMNCTYAASSGGGMYLYRFEYTGTSGQFTVGDTKSFYL